MINVSSRLSDSSPQKCLLTILNIGGEIIRAPDEISIMLNGLRYYSLEVAICNSYYNIQGYGEDALKLYKTAMTILSHRKARTRIIENN